MPFDGNSDQLDYIGQILLNAADLIERRGHTKNVRQDAAGRICLHGAIGLAITGDALWMEPAEFTVTERLHDFRPDVGTFSYYGWEVAKWNNMPERTAEEVIALLRGAAYHKVERKELADAI